MEDAVIVSAVRTPVGSFAGAFQGRARHPDLGAPRVVREAVSPRAGVSPGPDRGS